MCRPGRVERLSGPAHNKTCVRFVRYSSMIGGMTSALAHDDARRLRAAFDNVLDGANLRDATVVRRVVGDAINALESAGDAVVLPVGALLTTGEAANILGVNRMTVVRLVDRGHLTTVGGGSHRRIPAADVARYRQESRKRRREALAELAADINSDTPPDRIVKTR